MEVIIWLKILNKIHEALKVIMEDLKVNTFDELIDYMQKNPTEPLVQELENLLNKFN